MNVVPCFGPPLSGRDRTAVHFHEPLYQRQTDAQPARGSFDTPVHLREHVEDAG